MGIFSDVLLTADYDRTLTAINSVVPQRNIEAIEYFIANGGAFTVNTGRSVPMYRLTGEVVPVNAPLLLYNGSAAFDGRELTQIHAIDLPMYETLQEVAEVFPDLTLEIQSADAHYRVHENPSWDAFYERIGMPHGYAWPGRDVGPFIKFTLFCKEMPQSVSQLYEADPWEKELFDRAENWLRQRFGDKIEVFRAGVRILDMHAKGVSKGVAARQLLQHLGRKILVCAGDAENDIAMMEAADFAFCPADGILADRYPNVCVCDQGAVADVIYEKIPQILGIKA